MSVYNMTPSSLLVKIRARLYIQTQARPTSPVIQEENITDGDYCVDRFEQEEDSLCSFLFSSQEKRERDTDFWERITNDPAS